MSSKGSSSKDEKHQLERWNTHFSTVVEQEVLGCVVALCAESSRSRSRKHVLLIVLTSTVATPTPPCQHTCRVNLRLAQDPNSEHLGTTVWDASIVLAKFFEKVCGVQQSTAGSRGEGEQQGAHAAGYC